MLKSEETGEKDPEEAPDYGFGLAKHFMPLPNAVVGSHCAWEIRLNTLEGRIPGGDIGLKCTLLDDNICFFLSDTITEILCHSAGDQCGGSDYFSCKQMKARMLVAHTDQAWSVVRAMRNITINTGCSCVYR